MKPTIKDFSENILKGNKLTLTTAYNSIVTYYTEIEDSNYLITAMSKNSVFVNDVTLSEILKRGQQIISITHVKNYELIGIYNYS